jgi:hypothetical protein
MRKNLKFMTVAIIGITIMMSMANADVIAPVSVIPNMLNPTDPTYEGYIATNGTSLDNMINGSGLSDTDGDGVLGSAGDLHDQCITLVDHQAKETETFPGAFWAWELDQAYDITAIRMWNGTYDDLGVLNVYFGYTSPTHPLGWDAVLAPVDAPGIGVAEEVSVNYSGATMIYGWFTVNIGYDPDTGEFNGIGPTSVAEIRFEGTPSIPEPATIGLLGMGALGLIRRRRA